MATESEILSRLREAIVTLKDVRAQRDSLLSEKSEPIAIIGMACRFPGEANTPELFFDLLVRGVDTVTAVPPERWHVDPHIDTDPKLQGARWGAFVKNADLFDASFFGISPREAARLDPQQRFLLEIAWEALEHSGIVPASLADTKTGIFVGIMNTDYLQMNLSLPHEQHDAYSATGNGHCFPAGRLAYTFGFQGPAVTIDTACSSSLVATHLGCQSLRTGDSDVVLVCGVNLMLDPLTSEITAKTGALAPDGRCKSFDSRANGYVRGEGCGVIVLKRLSNAQRDGNPILALIRGSAVNQDGRSTGLTTPNGLSQQAVFKQALVNAQLAADDIGYIEAHGTGTPLGDPIEMEALTAVYGKPRHSGGRCMVGTVKTNVGHLEAAAGIAGLIKTAFVLQQEKIPKILQLRTMNPRISLEGTSIAIATDIVPWPRDSKPRRAGVSSFGMSGTNAHVILEEAPRVEPMAPEKERSAYLLPLSAKCPDSLSALAQSYAKLFSESNDLSLDNVVFTASIHRTHHEYRLAAVARTHQEFTDLLNAFTTEDAATGVTRGHATARSAPKVVFVFPGQGSQWLGMGRELLEEEPAFRQAIETCDHAIRAEAGFSILEQIGADESQSRISEIDVVQPLLFAIEVALAALWHSWGVVPDCIVGHSMGEVAAAHVAGMLSLGDAVKVICRRSRIMRRLRGQGAMGLVELPMAEAEAAIAEYRDRLSVAVSNGPRSTVLSGDPGALEHVLAALETNGVFCRRIKVDVASHSPQVDVLRDELLEALHDVKSTPGKSRMVSTVTGNPLQGTEISPTYWWHNLRQPVRFSHVAQELIRDKHSIFVELSPHPILLPSLEECLRNSGSEGFALASLRRQTAEKRAMLEAFGKLWTQGSRVDWRKVQRGGGRVVPLPTYPWRRERHWIELPQHSRRTRVSEQQLHPLLGPSFTTSTSDSANTWVWQSIWSLEDQPFFADHRIGNRVIVPSAAYIEAALAATRDKLGDGPILLEDVFFIKPLVLQPLTPVTIEIALTFESPDVFSFRFSSCAYQPEKAVDAPTWSLHARARIRRSSEQRPAASRLADAQKSCRTTITLDSVRATEQSLGMDIGPAFRGLREMRRENEHVLARIELPEVMGATDNGYHVHPIILDAALRVLIAAAPVPDDGAIYVLVGIQRLHFWNDVGPKAWTVGELRGAAEMHTASLTLFDDAEQAVLSIEGLETGRLANTALADDHLERIFHRQEWTQFDLHAKTKVQSNKRWLLLCDESGFGENVRRILVERGAYVICAWPSRDKSTVPADTRMVNPGSFEEVAALVHETMQSMTSIDGIINCWGLWPNQQDVITREVLENAQVYGCGGALHLVQALSQESIRDMPQLWLVTRGTQTVDTEPRDVFIAQASYWGLGRTIATECPELRCVRVDLDPLGNAAEADIFVALLNVEGIEEVALRNGAAFAGKLTASHLQKASSPTAIVRADASYLITGGLGGLGLLAANWLAKSGARHIVLLSRSGISTPAQARSVEDLIATGAQVMVLNADVSNAEQLARAFAEVDSKFPPLKGILHTAGILADGLLDKQTLDAFQKVLGPKMLGTWNLHEQTLHRELDFFILYSSMAALLGPPGLGNYVAANSFLDSFAHYRRQRGLSATSINWGLFVESGMGQKAQSNGLLSDRGVRSFNAADGELLLTRILHDGWIQMGLMSVDFRSFCESNPQFSSSPHLSSLLQEDNRDVRGRRLHERAPSNGRNDENRATDESTHVANAGSATLAAQAFRKTLERATISQQLQLLDEHICQQLAQVLRMKPSQIDRHEKIQHYGMDSLMAIELRNRLRTSLDIDFSVTEIWTHGSVNGLSRSLAARFGLNSSAPSPPIEEQAQTPARGGMATGATGQWVVIARPSPNAKMRLICFPYAGGGAPVYSSWHESLPPDIEVCAIQPPGRHARITESLMQSVEEMVDAIVPALLGYLDRPFAMFGHCLGAIIMFEVVRRLASDAWIHPIQLFASGAPTPRKYLVPNVGARSDEEFLVLLRAIGLAQKDVLNDPDIVRTMLPMVRTDFGIAAKYKYEPSAPIAAPITTFASDADAFAPPDVVEAWRQETTSHFSKHTYAGGHYFLVPERDSILRIVALEMEYRFAASQQQRTQVDPILWIVRNAPRRKGAVRVICFAGLGSSAIDFQYLAAILPPVEVCAIELPGRGTRANEAPLGQIDDMVDHVFRALRDHLDGPYIFLGHDLGALVMYEVAVRLHRAGSVLPKALMVFAAMAPHVHYFAPIHYLPREAFHGALGLLDVTPSSEPTFMRALQADCAALSSYGATQAVALPIPITAFIAETDHMIAAASVHQWKSCTNSDFILHQIPCGHHGFASNSEVERLLHEAIIPLFFA